MSGKINDISWHKEQIAAQLEFLGKVEYNPLNQGLHIRPFLKETVIDVEFHEVKPTEEKQ